MERNRRVPAPGVEEALSSMLWTPYPRTPSETSDDDEPIGKAPPQAHPLQQPPPATRFARLTRPLSFMDKRKSCTYAAADTHLYPEPIRYLQTGGQPEHDPHSLNTFTPSRTSLFQQHQQHQQRHTQLPSYELVEQERLHHSLNSIATATGPQLQPIAGTGTGIYFIAPYGRYAPGGVGNVGGTMLVNSFTDDFSQYQVSTYACVPCESWL